MAIIYDPQEMLKRIAPDSRIRKLFNSNLNFKRQALAFLKTIDFIDEKDIADLVLKTLKEYRKRAADAEGSTRAEKKKLAANPKQILQRVQNAVMFQTTQAIKEKYKGARYEWLPSDAEDPDPLHQLKYGKIFIVGQGEMPQDRYGCRCGMRILTDDEKLNL